jgi:hypothetical protein
MCFAQLRAGSSSIAAAAFRAASRQVSAFRAGSLGAVAHRFSLAKANSLAQARVVATV